MKTRLLNEEDQTWVNGECPSSHALILFKPSISYVQTRA